MKYLQYSLFICTWRFPISLSEKSFTNRYRISFWICENPPWQKIEFRVQWPQWLYTSKLQSVMVWCTVTFFGSQGCSKKSFLVRGASYEVKKWISLLKFTIEVLILVFCDYYKLTKTALICLSFCQNHLTLRLLYINNVNKGTDDNTYDSVLFKIMKMVRNELLHNKERKVCSARIFLDFKIDKELIRKFCLKG